MSTDISTTVDRLGPWRTERAQAPSDDAARWVPIGTRSSGAMAMVDPAGLVGLRGAGWSLDWWVGADDRWYLPARETAVRQTLVGHSPVVETRQRIPGGDVLHRVHAAQGGADLDDREVVVIELTNDTPIPVAIALAIRPYGVDDDDRGIATIDMLDKHGAIVDERWTVLADREARRAAVGGEGRDPVSAVTSGEATDTWATFTDLAGEASLALVFPLPHTATMRVILMAGPAPAEPDAAVAALPGPDVVASGWARQADHGLRAVLPDTVLTDALDTARRRLLLGAPDAASLVATEWATITRALSALGHHDDLRPMVGDLLDRQRLTGAVPDVIDSEAATGAALALLGDWWRHDPRPELLDELVGPVAKAAHRIERRRFVRKHRRDPKRRGLLPAGPQPVELGLPVMAYLDDWWSASGLLEASALIGASGQDEAAVDALRFARGVLDDIRRSLAAVQPDLADPAIPAGPDRPLDEGIVGLLVALTLPGVIDPAAPDVVRSVDLIRSELVDADGSVRAGVAGPAASPWLTACLAMHEITSGDPRGLDRLNGLLRAGGATFSWPRQLAERGLGLGGVGDHPAATAMVALALRSVLVTERRSAGDAHSTGLDVLPVMPPTWFGAGVELHDAPTTFGRFGFAVRWHGDRPALLWELDPVTHGAAPVITASALAPGWSTTELVGETLLDPPQAGPGATAPGQGAQGLDAAYIPDDDASFS